MQRKSRRSSTLSQSRRSTRTPSRQGSIVAIPQSTWPSSRQSSLGPGLDSLCGTDFSPFIDFNQFGAVQDDGIYDPSSLDPSVFLAPVSSDGAEGASTEYLFHNDWQFHFQNQTQSLDADGYGHALGVAESQKLQDGGLSMPNAARQVSHKMTEAPHVALPGSEAELLGFSAVQSQFTEPRDLLNFSEIRSLSIQPTSPQLVQSQYQYPPVPTQTALAPYYRQVLPQEFEEAHIDPRLMDPLAAAYESHQYQQLPTSNYSNLGKRRRSDSQVTNTSRAQCKRRRTRGDSSDSYPSYPSSSSHSRDSSMPPNERKVKQARRATQRKSVVLRKPVMGEKPQIDDNRPWVRVNNTTRGETTRTTKINHYSAGCYETFPLPLGDWKTSDGRYEFTYTSDGEFKEKTMSAKQIREFILRYPKEGDANYKDGARLTLWIQTGPTDSARRYKTASWSKCRFRDCPAHLHQTGTILHGHYRVAFDEKYYKYRDDTDPFLVSGYVHLYCLERFLDFEEICKYATVKVDTRQLSWEPNGKFAATLHGEVECNIAQVFVEWARAKRVRQLDDFANYPRGRDYRPGQPKPHRDTLTYHMHRVKNAMRPPAQIRQFRDRKLKPTHIVVHQGDLEFLFQEVARQKAKKQQQKKKKKVKGRKRQRPHRRSQYGSESESDDEDDYPAYVKQRIAEVEAEAEQQYGALSLTQPRKRRKFPVLPQRAECDLHDDEDDVEGDPRPWEEHSDYESDTEYQQQQKAGVRQGTRKSPRNKSQVNYNDANHDLLEPVGNVIYPQPSTGKPPHRYERVRGYELVQQLSQPPQLLSAREPKQSSQSQGTPIANSHCKDNMKFEDEHFLNQMDEIDRLIEENAAWYTGEELARRQSSLSSILRASNSSRSNSDAASSRRRRTASFADHPVTQTQEFDTTEAPNEIMPEKKLKNTARKQESLRRSARLHYKPYTKPESTAAERRNAKANKEYLTRRHDDDDEEKEKKNI